MKDYEVVDPNVAITFVVALPCHKVKKAKEGDVLVPNNYEFEFEPFNDFFVDLEERLFDEADYSEFSGKSSGEEREEEEGEKESALLFVPIGDLVTLAPFHPDWCFAPDRSTDDGVDVYSSFNGLRDFDAKNYDAKDIVDMQTVDNRGRLMENPINYEKRTPYPTISLVRTSAILAAGTESTTRIGEHNKKLLTRMGSHALEKLFRDKIVRDVKE